jgi:hypothetical protein
VISSNYSTIAFLTTEPTPSAPTIKSNVNDPGVSPPVVILVYEQSMDVTGVLK